MSSVSRGWRPAWCDPDLFENTYVREIIRGPFPSPKIACLLPFFDNCQNHCLTQFLGPHVKKNQPLSSKFQMTKENEDLLEAVRNNYGLSIGHGIPDPWITPPYCGLSHSHNDEMTDFLKKFIFQLLETKKNNHPCFCCEKRYLLGCPDGNEKDLKNLKNSLNCPCTNCHGKDGKDEKSSPECGENCKCIKTMKNWVLDNVHLLRNKNINETEKDDIASVISNKSNQKKFLNKKVEAKEQNEIYTCTCPPNESSTLKTSTYKTSTSESKCKKVYHVGYQFTPRASRMNVSSSKESPEETSESDAKKSFSRNSSDSYCKGCQCFMRCSSCGGQDSRSFCTQVCSSAQCLASYNPSYQISSNTPFSAPTYDNSTPPTREKKKKDRSSDKKKKKDKKKKEKYDISDSQSKSQDSQLEDSTSYLRRSSILKNVETKTSNDTTETSNSRIVHSRSISLPFDHLKYLTDHKLRRYLQRKELSKNSLSSQYPSFQSVSPLSSTFKNLCEGESLSLIALQKCRPFRYCRRDNAGDSSCDDTIRDWHYRPSTRKFNFGAQTSLSIIDEIDSPKNEIPTNIKFFKEVVESDESGICLPLRTYDKTYRENRIRRRLFANRKRRKKLLSKKNWCTFTPKVPDQAHKIVQVSENSEDSVVRCKNIPYEKRVSFDFDVGESRFFTVPSGWQLVEDPTASETYCRRFNEKRIISSNKRGNFENVLDKISYNSGTSWSSNTLKNMVDDLSVERKPTRYMLFDAGIQTANRNH